MVRHRKMVRNYTDQPVAPEFVELALHNATRAPSAGFSQGWGFLVLDTRADIERFWSVTADLDAPDDWLTGMRSAPVLIIPCSSKAGYLARYAEPDKGGTGADEERWSVPFWHMDAAMASLLILQTVVDHGLGACFFGIPPTQEPRVRSEFGIDPRFDPIGAISIGHPAPGGAAGSPRTRRRTPLEEVVHRGNWGS